MILSRPAHHRLISIAGRFLPAILLILGVLHAPTPSALAAAPAADPPLIPARLPLPVTAFPHGARLQAGAIGNQKADRVSGLHATPFAQLGRLSGELQTARWSVAESGKKTASFTLQYVPNIFPTPDDAAVAGQDARASLWEVGHFVRRLPTGSDAFTMTESQHRAETDAVGVAGQVEWELSLRYDSRDTAAAVSPATKVITRTDAAASRLIHALVDPLPVPPAPAGAGALPPIYDPPMGTGPVTESPSLLLAGQSAAGSALAPGSWRPAMPAVAARAAHHASIALNGSLAAYAQVVDPAAPATGMYDAASLYSTPRAADTALASLQRSNDNRSWLHRVTVAKVGEPHLALADAVYAWQGGGQVILAIRSQNVLMVLAQAGAGLPALLSLADRQLALVPTWLHAQGVQLFNGWGMPASLAGINWYGFDQQDFVAGGLDYRPYADILRSIKALGYDSIRLPFSDQMVEQNPVITQHVGANPDLQGLHALDIMDRIVQMAGALGLSVILDNHRSDAGWSAQESGLWYTPAYPDSAFDADWSALAGRYTAGNTVIGADLRNEPHGPASWGDGNAATDWQAAAQRAGNAVLAANPRLLIIVEGVQFYHAPAASQTTPSPTSTGPGPTNNYWWGGNLMGVAAEPVVLHFADGSSARSQLVYSAHDYGPDNCGTGCPWFNSATSYAGLSQIWDQYWGYITADPSKPYAAPVWVGEFGTCNYAATCVADSTPGSQGQWFSSLERYLGDHGLSWAYWSANGTQSTAGTRVYGQLDWYGLFGPDWTEPVLWLDQSLRALQQTTRSQTR